jgi:hypothetical protein
MPNLPSSPTSTLNLSTKVITMEQIEKSAAEAAAGSVATNSTTTSSSSNTTVVQKGVAGRINYDAWDKVAKDLVTQVDEEDEQEKSQEQKKVRSI